MIFAVWIAAEELTTAPLASVMIDRKTRARGFRDERIGMEDGGDEKNSELKSWLIPGGGLEWAGKP
jgi:hypothetical protein